MTVTELARRYRGALTGAGAALAAYLIVEVALPRSTPPGILLLGALAGLLTSLTAAGIVIIYRSQKIINFAQIALGTVGATILFHMVTRDIIPYALALPIALLAGPFMGLILGFIAVVLFGKHSRLVATVVTIFMLGLVQQVVAAIDQAFRQPTETFGPGGSFDPLPRPKLIIDGVPFGIPHLLGAILGAATLVGLTIFFRRSRAGIAVRAAAENPDRTALLGVNTKVLQVGVWGLAGLLASIGSTLSLPISGYAPFAGLNPLSILEALTAAIIGRMTSIPTAVVAAFAITFLRQAVTWSYPTTALFDIGLFVVVLGGIFVQRHRLIGRQVEALTTWQGTREIRPTPLELLRVPWVAAARRSVAGLLLLVALAVPWFGSESTAQFGSRIWIVGMVGISLVILTGWIGQISLGQYALVAVGAFASAVMTSRWGWSFWVAVPLASMVGAVFAVVVGLPALRIRGLFLAATTFALAVVVPIFIFRDDFLGRYVPDQVGRPHLFFLDLTDERSFYYVTLGVFALVMLVARALRRSRTGRVLIAMRDDEQGAQAFGVDIVRTRLSAFALSGFIAALAGAFLVHHDFGMSAASYAPGASLQIFIQSVVGGLSSLFGPLLGVLVFEGAIRLPFVVGALIIGIGPVLLLLLMPGGLTSLFVGMRDAALRVVALRNHIVVPSLFTDYSPEAWERRQAPLAPPLQGHGLAALGSERRYSLPSRLWGSSEAIEQSLELEETAPVWHGSTR